MKSMPSRQCPEVSRNGHITTEESGNVSNYFLLEPAVYEKKLCEEIKKNDAESQWFLLALKVAKNFFSPPLDAISPL